MPETVVDSGLRLYPANNGNDGEALARDHEIYARRQFHGVSHVETGAGLTQSGLTREVTVAAMRAFIDGRQCVDISDGSFTFTLPANETRYVMLQYAGKIVHRDTNDPDPDTELLLYTITTNGTGVTAFTDHRRFAQFSDVGVGDNEYVYLSTDRTKYLRFVSSANRVDLGGIFRLNDALDVNSQRIQNLTAPVSDNDAVRRVYVTDNFIQKADAATITARHTFQPASGSPFITTSSTKVVNLNSDLLDDLEASQFLRSDIADQVDGVLTYAAAPVLNNNIAIRGKNSTGTIRDLLFLDAANVLYLGHGSHATVVRASSHDLKVSDGSTAHKIWHAGNDGPGSTLDADTLDGIQGADIIKRDGTVPFTGTIDAGSQRLANLAAPTQANDAVRKVDLDAISQGLDPKPSVRVATTANITLSGTQTIDGIALQVDERVLVKNQTTGSQNGIYLVKSGAWTRSSDADASSEVTPGMFVFVEEGTVNADSGWVLTTNATITLGTTALTFVQFSGAGQITAGAALTKTGNQLDVAVDDATIEVSGDALRIKALGVGTSHLAASAVDNTKLASMAAQTLKGRSSGSGAPQDLSVSTHSVIGRAGTGNLGSITVGNNEVLARGAGDFASMAIAADRVLGRVGSGGLAGIQITDAHVASANKDGIAATPSLRTLGASAQQAAAGNHDHNSTYYTESEVDDIAGPYHTMKKNSGKIVEFVYVAGATSQAIYGSNGAVPSMHPSMRTGRTDEPLSGYMPTGAILRIMYRGMYADQMNDSGVGTVINLASGSTATLTANGAGHASTPRRFNLVYQDQAGLGQTANLFTATDGLEFTIEVVITVGADGASGHRNVTIQVLKDDVQVANVSARLASADRVPEAINQTGGNKIISPVVGRLELP